MKKYIAFILVMLLFATNMLHAQQSNQTQSGQQGWYRQQIASSGNSGGIFFINRDTGWATFNDGFFGTTNGGNTWAQISPLSTGAPHFVDIDNGWVVGDTSILRTSDGGKNWQPVHAPIRGIMQVFGMDTIRIYNSLGPTTASSNDGGKTWISSSVGFQGGGMYFTSSQTGFGGGVETPWFGSPPPQKGTVGADFELTTDGGISWHAEYCSVKQTLDVLYAIDQNNVFASASYPALPDMVHTTDGGNTWNVVPTGQWAFDFCFLNGKIGYSVGGGDLGNIIQFSEDSGKSWINQDSTVNSNLYHVFFVDSLTGWAAGEKGVILHTINGGKSSVQQSSYDPLTIQTYPDPVTSSSLNFHYTLPVSQHITLTLFDLMGQQVQAFLQGDFEDQGEHTITVTFPEQFANGTYYYLFQTEQYQSTGQITVTR